MTKYAIVQYYHFNPQHPEPFSFIHPLQVKSVMALVDENFPEYIDCVFLFGSSLDLTCSPYSDVDLYVLSAENKEAYAYLYNRCKVLKIKADILCGNYESFIEDALDINSIERQVLERGVVIYEKESLAA